MISSILCTKYCTLVPVAETAKTQLSFFSIVSFYTEFNDISLIVQLWIICVVSFKCFLNLPFRANFYPMTGLSQRYYDDDDDDDDDDLLTDLLIRRF